MQAVKDGTGVFNPNDNDSSDDKGSVTAITLIPCYQDEKLWLVNYSGSYGVRGDMVFMGYLLYPF